MGETRRPRILVVDDEEAILETMTYTFESEYEVFTSTDPRRALDLVDEHAPVSVVLTDQRMPEMSGVEFLAEVWKKHPSTVRMILTGFADMEAIIDAINQGHVYAYITKPWEPEHLKQVMRQAVEHYDLAVENERLLGDLQRANLYLEAVMDHLDTGALAVDAGGAIQALNRPLRETLSLEGEPRGHSLEKVLEKQGLGPLVASLARLDGPDAPPFEEVRLQAGARELQLRAASHGLTDAEGRTLGRVVLLREISHEPLRRRFDDELAGVLSAEGALRPVLEGARTALEALGRELGELQVDSAGAGQLGERISRTLTALENWLDVDEALAREDYPDAQLLQDRMRVALARWPLPNQIPGRVTALARRVEDYYESGENPKQPVL